MLDLRFRATPTHPNAKANPKMIYKLFEPNDSRASTLWRTRHPRSHSVVLRVDKHMQLTMGMLR